MQLSILLPTNRHGPATIARVAQACSWASPEIQVVVRDNSGNAGAFPAMSGELKDGRMVLITDEKVSPVSRWTWYAIPPDEVRQMAEQSTDGQKTWQITWDSYYVRKSAPVK